MSGLLACLEKRAAESTSSPELVIQHDVFIWLTRMQSSISCLQISDGFAEDPQHRRRSTLRQQQ
jgi:hypothetical protein